MNETAQQRRRELEVWLKQARNERSAFRQHLKAHIDRIKASSKEEEKKICARMSKLRTKLEAARCCVNKEIANIQIGASVWTSRLDHEVAAVEREILALDRNILVHDSVEPPSQLVCPITLDVMEDPVLATDGHTYDRKAIERHFEFNCIRQPGRPVLSPKTGEPLPSHDLFPNVAIRSLLREWQEKYALVHDL